jgi:hypothetical protein
MCSGRKTRTAARLTAGGVREEGDLVGVDVQQAVQEHVHCGEGCGG